LKARGCLIWHVALHAFFTWTVGLFLVVVMLFENWKIVSLNIANFSWSAGKWEF